MADETIQFSIKNENDEEMKKILLEVYNALNEKGYNSVSQIVGYISNGSGSIAQLFDGHSHVAHFAHDVFLLPRIVLRQEC